MATIPIIDTPQVDFNPGQVGTFQGTAVQPAENFTPKQIAEQGKAIQQLGAVAMKMQDEFDDAKTKEMSLILADKYRQIRNGYIEKVGKTAIDARPAIDKEMADARAEIEKGLENDMQRVMFKSIADKRALLTRQDLDEHLIRQRKVYAIGNSEATIDNFVENAVDTAKGFNVKGSQFQIYKASMMAEVNNLAELNGIPQDSEQYKQLTRKVTTKLHQAVITNALSTDQIGFAQAYLKDNKSEIDKEQLDNISLLVKNAAERAADKYEARANKAMMGASQEWILKNPGKNMLQMAVEAPELYKWAKNQGHLAGLEGFAAREGREGDAKDAMLLRGKLLLQAATEPEVFVDNFKKTGFTEHMVLGKQGIQQMQNIATDMINGNGKYKTPFDPKIFQDAIPKALLSNDKKDQRDAFNAIVAEKSMEWQRANPGKKPEQRDYNEIIRYANEDYISIGSIYNRTKPAYSVRSSKDEDSMPKSVFNEMNNIYSSDYDTDILKFYKGMRQAGATDREIVAAWKKKKGTK